MYDHSPNILSFNIPRYAAWDRKVRNCRKSAVTILYACLQQPIHCLNIARCDELKYILTLFVIRLGASLSSSSFSSVLGSSSSLHSTDEDGVDGKDIVGQLGITVCGVVFIFVVNQKSRVMELENVLKELECKSAHSIAVGAYNL